MVMRWCNMHTVRNVNSLQGISRGISKYLTNQEKMSEMKGRNLIKKKTTM